MGKTGRIICVFTPMVLTAASVIALTTLQASGWRRGLIEHYLIRIEFSNFSVAEPGSLNNWHGLKDTLYQEHGSGHLKDVYQVYLWNYCTAIGTSGDVEWCSIRRSKFVFDPVQEFGLNFTISDDGASTEMSEINSLMSLAEHWKDGAKLFREDLLSDAAPGILRVYKNVAEWNFIVHLLAYLTSILTVLMGLLAIFSRWGSLCTWIISIVRFFLIFLAASWNHVADSIVGLKRPYRVRCHHNNYFVYYFDHLFIRSAQSL